MMLSCALLVLNVSFPHIAHGAYMISYLLLPFYEDFGAPPTLARALFCVLGSVFTMLKNRKGAGEIRFVHSRGTFMQIYKILFPRNKMLP